MANEIKELFGASTALTITLASLASSTSGAGRQSTIVDNTSLKWGMIVVYIKIKQGTSPTGNRTVSVYLIKDDNNGTVHRSDGADVTDAGFTVLNAAKIGVMRNEASPSSGDVLYGEFRIFHPGPKWGITIVHDTGVDLDSTGSNHWVRYIGINPEVQ